mgnify:CR=1 FL=1
MFSALDIASRNSPQPGDGALRLFILFEDNFGVVRHRVAEFLFLARSLCEFSAEDILYIQHCSMYLFHVFDIKFVSLRFLIRIIFMCAQKKEKNKYILIFLFEI